MPVSDLVPLSVDVLQMSADAVLDFGGILVKINDSGLRDLAKHILDSPGG